MDEVEEVAETTETCKASELDMNNNHIMITMPSKGVTIGTPVTGKRVEVEEDDFPQEGALEGGEDASPILFIPTSKTTSTMMETARRTSLKKQLLYPNRLL